MNEPAAALAGLRVVEVAESPGAAFAGSLLADFGADVTVLEPLPAGSPLRRLGGSGLDGIWWPILARNKRSLGLDLAGPRAAAVLRRLAASADLVVLGPRDAGDGPAAACRHLLDASAPVLEVVPPGHDRPQSWPWGIASELTAAASGMMALTGEPDGAPVEPEFPLAECLAGAMAATQALLRLHAARRSGVAAAFPVFPMHLAVQRMVEWQTVVATAQGRAELRAGNRFPMNAGIANIFTTADGRLVACSAANEAVAGRLLGLIGGPDLRNDPRFRDGAARERNMDAVYQVIGDWMAARTADEAVALGREHDVVIGPIYRTDEVLADPHVAAREDVVAVAGPDGGSLRMPAPVPKIAGAGAVVRHAGPALGAGGGAALAAAGFTAGEIDDLRLSGAISARAAAAPGGGMADVR